MKVTIITYGWTAGHFNEYLFRQFRELGSLLRKRKHSLHLVIGFGDSEDGDKEWLIEQVKGLTTSLVDVEHGGKDYGSVINKERFKQLAGVGDKLLDAVPMDTDIFGLVESDLLVDVETLDNLIKSVTKNKAMVAPMVMSSPAHSPDTFYDTWAFVSNGRNFRAMQPHHYMIRRVDQFVPMDSVGSCFFVKWKWVKDIKFPEKDVVVGYCRQVRELGYPIYMDKTLEVYHP